MKLLMIGDDFGMSKALTMGILDCINHGALRSTALIVNLKDSEFAASYIPKLTNCAFGLSFNSTKGKSVLSKEEIPDLVDENGTFHSSGYYKKQEAYKTKEGRDSLFPKDQLYKEYKAQLNRYIELTGKKPDYCHGHSINPEVNVEVIKQIAKENDIFYAEEIREYDNIIDLPASKYERKDQSILGELETTYWDRLIENKDYILKQDVLRIWFHPGYVDYSLIEQSGLWLERVKDADFCQDERLLQWIKDNNVEVINMNDVKR